MINRAAIILRSKAPMLEWINASDPYDDNPQNRIEDFNRDRIVSLISDHEADDDKALTRWIKANYQTLFEAELEGWYTDESLWPQKRTFKLFQEWFVVECHSVFEDMVGTPFEYN
jgi:hypothetical protein